MGRHMGNNESVFIKKSSNNNTMIKMLEGWSTPIKKLILCSKLSKDLPIESRNLSPKSGEEYDKKREEEIKKGLPFIK